MRARQHPRTRRKTFIALLKATKARTCTPTHTQMHGEAHTSSGRARMHRTRERARSARCAAPDGQDVALLHLRLLQRVAELPHGPIFNPFTNPTELIAARTWLIISAMCRKLVAPTVYAPLKDRRSRGADEEPKPAYAPSAAESAAPFKQTLSNTLRVQRSSGSESLRGRAPWRAAGPARRAAAPGPRRGSR